MTETKYCIYSRMKLVEGHENWRPSEEHILPLTLGGSREFATWDVSSKYNSDYGSKIDAPFVDLLPYAIKRQQLDVKNYSGERKSIKFRVMSRRHNKPATLTIDPELNVSVRFEPSGNSTQYGEDLIIYTFEGAPEDVERMFKGALSKAGKRDQLLYALDGSPLITVAEAKAAGATVEASEFHARIEIPAQIWLRGVCKIVLGLGHLIMGPRWTFSPSADNLRCVLELPMSACERWIKKSFLLPAPPELATSFGIDATVRAQDLHTLAIIPRSRGDGPFALVSLFGGNGISDVAIDIGPDAANLIVKDDTLDPSTRLGVRIDPRARSVEWLTVRKWVAWSAPLTSNDF